MSSAEPVSPSYHASCIRKSRATPTCSLAPIRWDDDEDD